MPTVPARAAIAPLTVVAKAPTARETEAKEAKAKARAAMQAPVAARAAVRAAAKAAAREAARVAAKAMEKAAEAGKGNGKGRGSWSAAPFRLVMKEAWKRGKGKGAGGQRRTLGLALTGEVSEGASLRKAVDDAFKGACARAASCSHCPHTPPCASLCATPCAMCHAMLCSPPHPHIV